MVIMTERENTDMTDIDMPMGWMLLVDEDCC
jgi:hypothetical protein